MRISVLSVFPQTFDSFRASPVVSRAIGKGSVEFETVDIKEFAEGSFRKIDDSPCGGGPGMVLRVDTLSKALASVKTPKSHVVLLSPKGRTFNQQKAHEYASLEHLVLVCGHYEGVDARFEKYVDEQLSIGDFILTGGEFASMVVCDSVIRLLKGSLREGSAKEESFEDGLLEYPQYTHPIDFEGDKVPQVLLSGDQKRIGQWRLTQSLLQTVKHRPDLFETERFTQNLIGHSKAKVYMFEDQVLKVEETGEESEREAQVLSWLQGRLPVPEVLGCESNEGKQYLLMSRVKGKMLCDPSILNNPNRLYKSAIAALRTLWTVDIKDCPFTSDLDWLLRKARFNVENGLVEVEDKGFGSAEELLKWLEGNRPEEDPVFSHGDLCLPNVLVNCDGLTGFLDLGRCGISDRWRDIALLVRSLEANLSGRYGNVPAKEPFDQDLFFRMLGLEPDMDRIHYHMLLDELL